MCDGASRRCGFQHVRLAVGDDLNLDFGKKVHLRMRALVFWAWCLLRCAGARARQLRPPLAWLPSQKKKKSVKIKEDEVEVAPADEDMDLSMELGKKKKKKKAKARDEDFEGLVEGEEQEGAADGAASKSGLPWEGSDRDYTYEELLGELGWRWGGWILGGVAPRVGMHGRAVARLDTALAHEAQMSNAMQQVCATICLLHVCLFLF